MTLHRTCMHLASLVLHSRQEWQCASVHAVMMLIASCDGYTCSLQPQVECLQPQLLTLVVAKAQAALACNLLLQYVQAGIISMNRYPLQSHLWKCPPIHKPCGAEALPNSVASCTCVNGWFMSQSTGCQRPI